MLTPPFLKVYRNVYLKGYDKIPYQKLTGRNTVLYKGKLICGVLEKPKDFDENSDLYIDCDCDFPRWKTIKKI